MAIESMKLFLFDWCIFWISESISTFGLWLINQCIVIRRWGNATERSNPIRFLYHEYLIPLTYTLQSILLIDWLTSALLVTLDKLSSSYLPISAGKNYCSLNLKNFWKVRDGLDYVYTYTLHMWMTSFYGLYGWLVSRNCIIFTSMHGHPKCRTIYAPKIEKWKTLSN